MLMIYLLQVNQGLAQQFIGSIGQDGYIKDLGATKQILGIEVHRYGKMVSCGCH